jgi:hypothetical protein
MGEVVYGQGNGSTFIKPEPETKKLKLKSIVKDKQDVEWRCKLSKEEFNRQKEDYVVEVYNDRKIFVKKYLKSFLTFIKNTSKEEHEDK